MKKTLSQKLRDLKNGYTLKLGERTWAEKSGDGKVVRFVRKNGNVETVFRTVQTITL